jgi:FkbM family methyltransferase
MIPLAVLFNLYKVNAIFDIGANIGMSAELFRSIGFRHLIVSFEPVSHLFSQLKDRAVKDPLWYIENVALGDAIGEGEINVSGGHAGASSILEMTENVIKNAPDQCVVRKEKIRIKTLDSLINDYYVMGDRLFLKIDVQGYEKNVLDGAMQSLSRVIGIGMEMSIVKNYEGEQLIGDILPYIYSLGFRLVSLERGWSNPVTGEIYQINGIFFRTDKL